MGCRQASQRAMHRLPVLARVSQWRRVPDELVSRRFGRAICIAVDGCVDLPVPTLAPHRSPNDCDLDCCSEACGRTHVLGSYDSLAANGIPNSPGSAGPLASSSRPLALGPEASGSDAPAWNAIVEGVVSQEGQCASWLGYRRNASRVPRCRRLARVLFVPETGAAAVGTG